MCTKCTGATPMLLWPKTPALSSSHAREDTAPPAGSRCHCCFYDPLLAVSSRKAPHAQCAVPVQSKTSMDGTSPSVGLAEHCVGLARPVLVQLKCCGDTARSSWVGPHKTYTVFENAQVRACAVYRRLQLDRHAAPGARGALQDDDWNTPTRGLTSGKEPEAVTCMGMITELPSVRRRTWSTTSASRCILHIASPAGKRGAVLMLD